MSKQQRLKEPQQDESLQQLRVQLDVISPSNPLAIPELLELTCQFLDRQSLTVCLRVCRQWHQILNCRVWKEIEKQFEREAPDSHASNGPSLILISQNVNHIRKLTLTITCAVKFLEFISQHPIHCPGLTELTIDLQRKFGYIRRTHDESLSSLIVRHRASLKKLVLRMGQSRALTNAMAACSRLESLTTYMPYMERYNGWMEWYESQGSRLQSLTVIQWKPNPINDFTSGNGFSTDLDIDPRTYDLMDVVMDGLLSTRSVTALQSLDMETGYLFPPILQGQLLLVMKSPLLRRLSWSGTATITQLARAFENSQHGLFCQKLESLSMRYNRTFIPEDFKRVLESLPALTDLDLKGCPGVDTIPSQISPYFLTLNLRRLRVDTCSWATPNVIQDFLCSMPILEVLIADYVMDLAIQRDPRPWVCTGLRELTVGFGVHPVLTGGILIMERLAMLDKLENLTVWQGSLQALGWAERSFGSEWATDMQVTLGRGLDRLKTLKRLRTLNVVNTVTKWHKDDAQWALENLVRLTSLDVCVDEEAGVLLQHRLGEKKN